VAFKVILSATALDDIERLHAFLASKWGEEKANQAYIELMEKLRLLATQPRLGRVVQSLADRGYANYYLLIHAKHTKILYRLDAQNRILKVHTIFGSRQNFQALLYKRIIRQR
jgi:plasmid stabilization system protein ParE